MKLQDQPVDDVLIIDEVATNLGNCFMSFAKSMRESEQNNDIKMLDIIKDNITMTHVAERIQKAQIVFFLEAAFTQELLNVCTLLRRPPPPSPPTVRRRSQQINQLQRNARHLKTGLVQTTMEDHYVVLTPNHKKIAIYDPDQSRGVFGRLVEYDTFQYLYNSLCNAVFNDKLRVVVYAASSRTAVRIAQGLREHCMNPTPNFVIMNADTVRERGRDRVLQDMQQSQVATISSVMCSGFSFETVDKYDVVYLFMEFCKLTPPPPLWRTWYS